MKKLKWSFPKIFMELGTKNGLRKLTTVLGALLLVVFIIYISEILFNSSKTLDSVDKFLNAGNSSFKSADSLQDPNEKLKAYKQALSIFNEGVLKFPQDISLKYDYEFTKRKVDELSKTCNDNQNCDGNCQNKEENGADKKEGQEKEASKGEQGNGKNSEQNKNLGQAGSGIDMMGQTGSQLGAVGSGLEPAGSGFGMMGSALNPNENEDQKTNDSKNIMNAQNPAGSQLDPNNSEVIQILKMLERQEEQSLKNNQEVKNKGKGDKYDW